MVTWLAKCRASPGVPQLLLQSWDWAGSRPWPGLPHLPGPPSSSAFILSRHLSQGAPVMLRWAAKTYINFQAGGNPSWGGKHLPSHFPSPLSVLPRLPRGGQGRLVSSRSSPPRPLKTSLLQQPALLSLVPSKEGTNFGAWNGSSSLKEYQLSVLHSSIGASSRWVF